MFLFPCSYHIAKGSIDVFNQFRCWMTSKATLYTAHCLPRWLRLIFCRFDGLPYHSKVSARTNPLKICQKEHEWETSARIEKCMFTLLSSDHRPIDPHLHLSKWHVFKRDTSHPFFLETIHSQTSPHTSRPVSPNSVSSCSSSTHTVSLQLDRTLAKGTPEHSDLSVDRIHTQKYIYIYYYFQVNHTQDVLSVLLLKVKLCHEKRQEEKAHWADEKRRSQARPLNRQKTRKRRQRPRRILTRRTVVGTLCHRVEFVDRILGAIHHISTDVIVRIVVSRKTVFTNQMKMSTVAWTRKTSRIKMGEVPSMYLNRVCSFHRSAIRNHWTYCVKSILPMNIDCLLQRNGTRRNTSFEKTGQCFLRR